jgi:hypothetical protein
VITVWVVVAVAVVGVVIAIVTSWQHRDPHADLGAVSNQWISEHRIDQGHHHQR